MRFRFWSRKPVAPDPALGMESVVPIPSKPVTPATLLRDAVSPLAVLGTLVLKGKVFHVLERPWLDNKRNESCIPAGTYEATFLPRSASGKYKNVYHLQDVPGRGGILIHSGNVVDHTKGCLIIGKRRGTLSGQPAVLNSRTALGELVDMFGGEDFILTIEGDQTWSES